MPKPVRIGLLGASKIARGAVIAPASRRDDFTISAVAARDPARARAYADKYGIPAVAADYAELVGRDDVDVVYNALPPVGHAPWTIASLEAGKPVLCEKPFARSAAEARAMVAAAERAGLPLLEAFHYRLHRVMRDAVALVRAGAIGTPRRGEAQFDAPIPRAPEELRWRDDLGGGAMMDLGCYPLHAMRSLFGAEPEIVEARSTLEGDVDTQTSATLAFAGGGGAKIACSMVAEGFAARLRLEGEAGALDIVNFLAPQIGCRFTLTRGGEASELPTDGASTYEAQLDHLGGVLAGSETALVGGADAIANMAAIDAIRAAARA